MNRTRLIEIIKNEPYRIGKLIGFNDLTSLHNEWIISMLQNKEDTTLQSHRGSYKTTCVSIALALLIISRPSKTILFMRKTDSDVKEVITQVKKILSDEKIIAIANCLYPNYPLLKITTSNIGEINTNFANTVKGTPQLVGLGIGASITGKHFDYIFTDDIVNVQDRVSKAERERTKLIYQELQNIKNRGGRIFNTGTPWHKDDCFIIMPTAKKYDCYSTNLINDEKLEQLKKSMTPSLFSANYELKHIADEDVIFANPNINADISLVEQGDCHIDASYGGEDFTAFTICKKANGKYFVFGKLWHKHIDDITDEIIKYRLLFNGGRIFVEDNGDKGYLAKALRQKGERVSKYHENMNKYLKITSYLKGEWENVYFVKGTDKEYIDQICDYNENAEHDDAPDSLASIIRAKWNKADDSTQYKSILK